MATNLALDQNLPDRAFRVSGEPTEEAAVTRALQKFIARREQWRVADLFGKLDWNAGYDYIAERTREFCALRRHRRQPLESGARRGN